MVVFSVTELSAGVESVSLPPTLASLTSVPDEMGRTTMVTVSVAPAFRLPMLKVRIPSTGAPPAGGRNQDRARR
jgi:hypothetical protein